MFNLYKKVFYLLIIILFVLPFRDAFSQSNQSVIQWFTDQYHYINPELDISADSLEKLSSNWNKATDVSLNAERRQEALQTLVTTMVNIQDVEQRYTPTAISALVAQYRSLVGLKVPPSTAIEGSDKNLNYNHVRPVGNGKKVVILLSDIFTDTSLYQTFIDRFKDEFTFHPINLPGIGDTPPLPLPEHREYVSAPWFSQTEQAITDYIRQNSIENPIIIGSWGSGYLAARLGVNYPNLISRIVLLNAPVNMLFMMDRTNPTGLSPVQTRINYLENQVPNIFPWPEQKARLETARGFAEFFTSDQNFLPKLVESQSRVNPRVIQQYLGELFAQDYSAAFSKLSVPLLSVTSLHEPDGRTGSGGFQLITNEWEKIRVDFSENPIEHVILEDTRTYIASDAPGELGSMLKGFINGKIVDPKDADPSKRGYQLSPRVMHRGMIGATAIEIDYGSPSTRGRDIYGNIVRYGMPWRAGANDITNIIFFKDVKIDGKEIPKGRYGFFVIPKAEEPWEAILTDYATGVGVGSFAYDSTYKLISFDVHPVETEPEEHLRYFVEQKSAIGGVFGFTWAGKRIEIDIETPADIDSILTSDTLPVQDRNWTLLSSEDEPDGTNDNNADAKRVSYHYDSGSGVLWFKIELEKTIGHKNIGFNLVIDQDQNQKTGSNWWGGSNSSFTYDRLGTFFATEAVTGKYVGTIGFSDDEFLANSDLTHNARNNFRAAIDEENNIWYLGAPLKGIDPDGQFDFSIAVGSSTSWNDDIPDSGFLSIDLSREAN